MKPIYVLVGAPGSGKTWVGRQLVGRFHHVENDVFIGRPYPHYLNAIAEAARRDDKPVLCDVPFSLSKLQEPLERLGFHCHPVFIIEDPEVTRARYEKREGKPIPQGHLTRINTYRDRAISTGAPHGTSEQILRYLQQV